MAEATAPLKTIIDQFEDVRGEPDDTMWARGVARALLSRDVDETLVREGVLDALQLVRQAHEAPTDLFGGPREHAEALHQQWLAEDRLHLADSRVVTWRDVPLGGLVASAFFAAVLAILLPIQGRASVDWSIATPFLPVALGMGPTATVATWETVVRRRGTLAAVAGAGLAVVAIATVAATSLYVAAGLVTVRAGAWWFLVVAGVCALLAILWRRAVLDRLEPQERGTMSDDEWSTALAGILRGLHGLSEERVRDVLRETRAHLAESRRPAGEEFGSPEAYSARFAPNTARKGRMVAALWGFLALASAGTLPWSFSWGLVILTCLFALACANTYRRSRG